MKIHRFIGNFDLKTGQLKLEDRELFNQFRNVLKLKPGEQVILCDGNMNEGTAEIKGYGKEIIDIEILNIGKNLNEPERNVILYCAVLKNENLEFVVQKATETGVREIVPVITDRTIKLNIRSERLNKIIKEASEQAGRGIVPVLKDPVEFEKALEVAKSNSLNIMFNSSGESFNGSERLNGIGKVGIFVGPEGGWTAKELELAQGSDFKIINLGKLTLRAETAAIIGAYLVVHNL
jgi:16S rRNA (uracil1498-N3)-methyltransferase